MSTSVPELADFPSIALPELTATASLQTRVDRKYVVPVAVEQALLEDLGAASSARVLEIDGSRAASYESVYFDTPDMSSYLAAAHRRRRRFKVRRRHYRDTGACFLEVKTKASRGTTVKNRIEYRPGSSPILGAAGGQFIRDLFDEQRIATSIVPRLRPTLRVCYERSTMSLVGAPARATIDRGITWRAGPVAASLIGVYVIETKTAGRPSVVDKWLWAHGHRPERISKYGVGMAALHPWLPANKWHRTLDLHIRPNLVEADRDRGGVIKEYS